MDGKEEKQPEKVKLTKKVIHEQIANAKALIQENIGVIKFCEGMLQATDIPEE